MSARRKVMIALGTGVLCAALPMFAQQPAKVWRLGYLSTSFKTSAGNPTHRNYLAFLEGLREAGYVEGMNLRLEERYADDVYQRLPGLASDLVRLNVDAIAAVSPPAVQAARRATSTVPIVMLATSDPVERGIIASLARPGGNVTGPAGRGYDLADKHVELMRIAAPNIKRMSVLINPDNADAPRVVKLAENAARILGLSITPVQAKSAIEIDTAFQAIAKARAGALIVAPDLFFVTEARRINELALKARLPTIYWISGPVDRGGFMSYGSNPVDEFRRAASYVDRIFKGAKPAEMPAEQPTKLELVINKKTAKAIGLVIPQELLLRADRVIE